MFQRLGVILMILDQISDIFYITQSKFGSTALYWLVFSFILAQPLAITILIISIEDNRGYTSYANQLKDIQLKGRITNGTNIVLDELDAAGKVVARFDGNFPDHNGNEKLECEVIVGTWRKLDTPETLPIYLSWHDSTDGTLKNRYGAAGVRNDSLINQNALLFWNAVKHGDKNTVASFIAYPTKVSISGRMRRINSPKELTANYDAIFSPRYREAITNALPHNMFVNSQGVMLGNGEVWFGSDGKVKRLNNDMTGR